MDHDCIPGCVCRGVNAVDRDGLPDVGVSDLDVSDLAGDCSVIAGLPQLFHVLLNRTPAPLVGQPFAGPDECELAVWGETLVSGDCASTPVVGNPQPWNKNSVYDFAFLDLNQDGFQDILFGLCDGLITAKGKAMRVGSVVAKIAIEPTPRPYADHRAYCLFFANGTCGKCIDRCPVRAITEAGHDKEKCRQHLVRSSEYVKKNF